MKWVLAHIPQNPIILCCKPSSVKMKACILRYNQNGLSHISPHGFPFL